MEEGYRLPKLEEFVEGFEYEINVGKKKCSFFIIDFSDNNQQPSIQEQIKSNEFITPDKWVINKVSSLWWFDKTFDEQSYIDQGLLRVKI